MVDFDSLPTSWCRDRYPWDTGVWWNAICEHETQSPTRIGGAQATIQYLHEPGDTAGIHYAVDPAYIWRGTDHRSRDLGRSPHCYRPSRWSVGIEHCCYTVPGAYDSQDAQDMLMVSATLHASLMDEWEARTGETFPLVELDVDGVINRLPGCFSHDTATKACQKMNWPQSGHYNGRYFPFEQLFEYIRLVRGQAPTPVPQEDDMPQVYTFFPPGSTPQENGLQAFVEVEWATGQVHGWHGVTFSGAASDEALGGDLRTVDFVKLNAGQPIRDFRIDEGTGQIVGFGQGGGIFRVTAVAG